MMEPDTSFTEVDLKQERFEDVKEEGEKYHCDLCDKEMVHKIALVLLEGLSTACVDNTTGDIFRSPGMVAADIRKEMLEYLTERSQSFIAETLILEGRPEEEIADQPSDIISDFIEDFTSLKRNLLSRVSGWLLSETREDKIDDFVQEMDLNSFWLLDRREAVAHTLLKNVDFKNEFHCNMKFKSEAELEQHHLQCGFRTLLCANEGCNATFSAAHMLKHDSICPFKILPCDQKCPEILLRRDMDRHCITVCPMKLVNCPFYSIGCKATVPSSNIQQHFTDDVRAHLLFALQYFHKGVSANDLGPRAEQIAQDSSGRLAGMQGVRSFTNAVKDLDLKLGPFKVTKNNVAIVEDTKVFDEPLAEDTMKSNSEEHSSVDMRKSCSGADLKDPDFAVTLGEDTTKSERLSAEDAPTSDSKEPPEDTRKSYSEEAPTESAMKQHSEKPCNEGTKYFGEPPVEDTVRSDYGERQEGGIKKLDSKEPPTEEPQKSEGHPSVDANQSDSGEARAGDLINSDSEEPVAEQLGS